MDENPIYDAVVHNLNIDPECLYKAHEFRLAAILFKHSPKKD